MSASEIAFIHASRATLATIRFPLHVRVEQARAAAIEGERVGGHLPELLTKRIGVRVHELGESVNQHVDDLSLTLIGGLVLPTQVHSSGHWAPFTVGRDGFIIISPVNSSTTSIG